MFTTTLKCLFARQVLLAHLADTEKGWYARTQTAPSDTLPCPDLAALACSSLHATHLSIMMYRKKKNSVSVI